MSLGNISKYVLKGHNILIICRQIIEKNDNYRGCRKVQHKVISSQKYYD